MQVGYEDLWREPGPRMLVEALKTWGVRETPGRASNPTIMAWADETGLRNVYSKDEIPWCGLWMAVIAKRAGWDDQIPDNPLWARNWAAFGAKADVPSLGDILVFRRDRGGHVAIYVGEDARYYHILGGNQSDAVNIVRRGKSTLIAARRPVWRVAEPSNRRPIVRAATGKISTNEA